MEEQQQEHATSAELVLADRIETAVQKLEPEIISKIQSLTLKLKTTDGQELEIPISEINMGSSARPAHEDETIYGMKAGPQIGFIRCGNCLQRLPRYKEQAINHHMMMEHNLTCSKRTAQAQQHADLVEEFRLQESRIDEPTRRLRESMSSPERPFLSADSPKRIGGADELKSYIAEQEKRNADTDQLEKKALKFVWWKPWTWF